MKNFNNIIKEELDATIPEFIESQKAADKYVTGQTASKYQSAVEGNGHGWIAGAGYIGTLERGRGPGKVPMYFYAIIMRWAKAKGLTFKSEEDLEQFAKAVEWKTRKQGSYMNRHGQVVSIFKKPIDRLTKRVNARLAPLLAAEVINQVNLTRDGNSTTI